MAVRPAVVVEHDDKSPLTLADLRELLAVADRAGIAATAQVSARVTMGGKLKRVEVQ